ncbi:HAD-IA family hydrolase [Citreimonas salinaria]|uniref:phosphoglycolate phosphatase n=1 Tax=Citreimonas salinaria TaxID=321339 RepID=A0A1H3GX14_9RHOB|nr:HAD-IA family hydrolase [Citreimonas salinaria]SDY07168.1 phosphoglycolate phosphatase [Citreimonas salinaria]
MIGAAVTGRGRATVPVVFDLDGTLVDSLPGIAWAANTLLAERGHAPLPQARIGTFVGLGERVFLDRLIAAAGLDAADDAALMARLLDLYRAAADRTTPFPGAREALQDLRDAGVPLGLCTNKPSGPLDAVLDALDLRGLFGAVVAGDTLPVRKPDPAPLHRAFDLLGGLGLYVGDNGIDARTATSAGVPFWLFTEGIRHEPLADIPHDRAFDDFARLAALYRATFA